MTRATLLHLLAHPAALTGPDVRALEELAQAFPYCQSAHLLLAKAAHDQGSMLAAQRLRRAATYAADRTCLRQLIELTAPAEETPALAEVETAAAAVATAQVTASQPVLATVADELPAPATSAPAPAPADKPAVVSFEDKPDQLIGSAAAASKTEATPAVEAEAQSIASSPATAGATAATPTTAPAAASPPAADAAPAPAVAALPEAKTLVAPDAPALPETAAAQATAPTSEAEAVSAPLPETSAALVAGPTPLLDTEAIASAPSAEAAETAAPEAAGGAPAAASPVAPAEAADADVAPAAELPPEAELPAQAPPIRPPAEAEAARLEFGLTQAEPAEIIAYRLPELAEPAAAAPLSATPYLPAFSGLTDIHYAPGEGSRLGFCLVPASATETLATALPPTGEFFAPDALLLEHLAAHQPPAPPRPNSPLDLINSFLQRAPIASRRRAMPTPAMPDADPQADLSVRSTRAEPDLASENLAHILARQGKNERAIAVYERLMVKYPEKLAYFAAQIESLRPLA